jgi:hypothetical protein
MRGALLYYTVLGVLLGIVYLKRGLSSSMAAHAAFNGTLVFLALAVALGPAHTLTAPGLSMRVPAGWRASDGAAEGRTALVAAGPSGSGVIVIREVISPGQAAPDLQQAADAINQRGSLPGVEAVSGAVRVVDEPFGPALRVPIRAKGHSGEVVVAVRPDAAWTVVFISAGSGRAVHDFEGILQRLQFT